MFFTNLFSALRVQICEFNRITDSDKEIKIIINDIPIEQVSHSKLLGIHIDQSLTWSLQVAKIKKTVVYKLFLLKRIRPFLPTQSRIYFVFQLLHKTVFGVLL